MARCSPQIQQRMALANGHAAHPALRLGQALLTRVLIGRYYLFCCWFVGKPTDHVFRRLCWVVFCC